MKTVNKNFLIGLCFVFGMSLQSQAQTEDTATSKSQISEPSARPFAPESAYRISLINSNLEMLVTTSLQGDSIEARGELEQAVGLSVGYSFLPLKKLGGSVALTLFELKNNGESLNLLRFETNLGLSISRYLNFKVGPNISGFTSDKVRDNWDTFVGFQSSLEYSLSPRLGLNLGLSEMNQLGRLETPLGFVAAESKERAFEVGLSALF